MTEYIIQWLALLCLVIILIILIALLYFYVSGKLEKRREKQWLAALYRARLEIGRRLIVDSYYFSHNREAFKLIYMLGEEFCTKGDYNIEHFRKKFDKTPTDTFSP